MDNRIGSDPQICFGEPRVIAKRVPVSAPVGCFIAGDSADEVASGYGLTWAEMEDCLRFALFTLRQREKYLMGRDPLRRIDYRGPR